jgi:hypothetical protein
MTVGEALTNPATALGRAAADLAAERAKRTAAARTLVAERGITLEEAFALVWNVTP